MKWKELMKRKRLLSLSLVAIATLATIFISHAIKRITTQRTDNDQPTYTFPINTDGDQVVQGFDSTDSGTPLGNGPTSTQLADNSEVVHGSDGTGSGIFFDNTSALTQLTDDSDDDSGPTTNASKTSLDDASMTIQLADTKYPDYDLDLQIYRNSDGTGSGTVISTPDEQPPHSPVPEPSAMLVLGSGLMGLVAVGKKLRKS